MSKILVLSLFISVTLHLLTFSYFNSNVKITKKPKQSTTNKIVPVGYQQIKYVKLVKPKPKVKPKKIQKPIEKKELKKKPKIKKKIQNPILKKKEVLKETKKYIKVPPKAKKLNKVLPKAIPKVNTKNIFEQHRQLVKEKQKLKEKIKDLKEIEKLDKQTQSYLKLYGQEYFTYSKETKKYLNNNLNNIGRITQMYLRYPRISIKTKQQGMNIVQFFLYPNGDIKDLKIMNGSGYETLDKNTIKTIKLAYKDYPRPQEKTKVKIYVYYSLR
ncbi:MAG: TonB family protein [Campylobacteraceae bacterium]|nr:TonB family protein [Campylobacteraceae bacterium]MBT6577739.1 TonB family protein [Campylobacteraceae bacterium]MBT7273741.1 TonB family protein [Campylobacteraceae bacterium]